MRSLEMNPEMNAVNAVGLQSIHKSKHSDGNKNVDRYEIKRRSHTIQTYLFYTHITSFQFTQ